MAEHGLVLRSCEGSAMSETALGETALDKGMLGCEMGRIWKHLRMANWHRGKLRIGFSPKGQCIRGFIAFMYIV